MKKSNLLEWKEKMEALSLSREISIMEVCGSHTMAMAKHAIKSFLPEKVRIISGPGCPVCVTDASDMQLAIDAAKHPEVIVATFGDMLKVPVEGDSLQNYSNVKIIYSPMEAISLAQEHPEKEIVLIGIGFETTIPLIAATVKKAYELGLSNFSVLPMHKLVPPALDVIFSDKTIKVDALLLPGHVSVITGAKYFESISKYGVPGVISGFDAHDLMEAIYLLLTMVLAGKSGMVNNYERVVSYEGNRLAQAVVEEIYEVAPSNWREIGEIAGSGYKLKEKYKHLDGKDRLGLIQKKVSSPKGCLCGAILMGKALPKDCKLFGRSCTPATPIGPCMVSSEGTCAAHFKYSR